ncbi:MAG TPA: hypothetical protein VEY07_05105, partial [Thermoplasmata archaeon]|nr:hypothetical protein [Thermoplasmata archaeon]
LRDLRALVHLYRHRSEQSKAYYHPFPFDPIRLSSVFLWLIATRRWVRRLMRPLSGKCGVVLVAVPPGGTSLVGYGTVRPEVDADGSLVAKFGFLVEDGMQNRGVGSQIMEAQALVTRELGIRRAIGTIIASNTPSMKTAKGYGWSIWPTDRPDRHAPGKPNLAAAVDLDEILRRRGRATPRGKVDLGRGVRDEVLRPTDGSVDPVFEAYPLAPAERAQSVVARH